MGAGAAAQAADLGVEGVPTVVEEVGGTQAETEAMEVQVGLGAVAGPVAAGEPGAVKEPGVAAEALAALAGEAAREVATVEVTELAEEVAETAAAVARSALAAAARAGTCWRSFPCPQTRKTWTTS